MKKIFVLFLAILAMACFSVPVFAVETGSDGSLTMGSSPTSTTVRLSANVVARYHSASGTSYSAATYNDKGVGRDYGTASDTTYVYYQAATGDSVAGLPTLANGDSRDVTSGNWIQVGGE